MIRIAIALVVSVLIVTASSAASPDHISACSSAPLDKVIVGFTLTHTAADLKADALCAAGAKGSAVSPDSNVIANYNSPQIRSRVQQNLKTMHDEGARWARDIVWFRLAEDPQSKAPDRLGMLLATGGKLPDPDIRNIVDYASDVQAAGYERMVLVIGAQGPASPKCGGGKCYDASFNSEVWSVAAQVIAALKQAHLSSLDLVYDIAPEECFGLATANAGNLQQFATQMLSLYKQTFGDDHHWIMSCSTGASETPTAIAFRDRMTRNALALWNRLGMRPAYIDIHMYWTDSAAISPLLLAAQAQAASANLPFVVGETAVDDAALFETAGELVKSGKLSNLEAILAWPKTSASACSINVPPPFDMRAINGWLGRPGYSNETACPPAWALGRRQTF